MYVEVCTKALLKQILPMIDPKKEGLTIDIGLGTHDFYFQLFNSLKFPTVAVEPLPTDEVYQLCRTDRITLIESCISDVDGQVAMYVGNREDKEDYNLNSLRANWWGASENTISVNSMRLSTLLNQLNPKTVTCLKIDVEGMEWAIIKQLQDLPTQWLPKVVVFEYGGGGTQNEQKGGWSPEILEETKKSLEMIVNSGYQQVILIDLASDLPEKVLNLMTSSLEISTFFPPQSIYGNIIALRDFQYPEKQIANICKSYYTREQPQGILQRLFSKVF